VEQSLSHEHGEFTLFGLFLREEAPARWDLVVAAPWATDRLAAIRLLSKALIKSLTKDEAILVSRVVSLDPDDRFLKAVCKAVSVRHGLERVAGDFDSVSIQDGYVISCGKPAGN
jgi:hypothetical protein